MTRAAAVSPRRTSAGTRGSGTSARGLFGYFQRSELPLTSLAFLLPLIVLYELGTRYALSGTSGFHPTASEQRIIAFNLMQRFFNACGASGRYLPAMAVVGILLSWHIARRDTWRLSVPTLLMMFVESVVLSLPLLLLGFAVSRYVGMFAAERAQHLLVLSVGAGIYEELVFRLIAFTVLHMLLIDVLKVRTNNAYLLMVLSTAVAFAGYHYLGEERFYWPTFAFRALAGAYFGLVFVFRGFGITAGTHAGYDCVLVLMRLIPLR